MSDQLFNHCINVLADHKIKAYNEKRKEYNKFLYQKMRNRFLTILGREREREREHIQFFIIIFM
jgi:hypothetical protein